MSDNIVIEGYRYIDLHFVLPSDIDPAVAAAITAKPNISGLRLRDYVLDGGKIGVELGESNRVPGAPNYWYSAQCAVLPGPEQTEDHIGTMSLSQRNEEGTVLQTIEAQLDELDNGHILDRLRGAVLTLHAQTVGPGPHATGPKRKPKP